MKKKLMVRTDALPVEAEQPAANQGQGANDLIGDIHAHGEKLEVILGELGYHSAEDAWMQRDRIAVLGGDFIDRGPGNVRTSECVRKIVEADGVKASVGPRMA